jgi:hypothetical protein
VRVRYEPTDSVRVVAEETGHRAVYGEVEMGAPVRAPWRIMKTIEKGWSKETCWMCRERIGPAFQPFGYRDVRDVASGLNSLGYWLCERDYERYALPHDLGFLL